MERSARAHFVTSGLIQAQLIEVSGVATRWVGEEHSGLLLPGSICRCIRCTKTGDMCLPPQSPVLPWVAWAAVWRVLMAAQTPLGSL